LSELEVLVELQELDTRLSQLAHRSKTLPEYQQLAILQAEDSELKNSFDEIEVELSALRRSQNDREAEIQQLEDKIAKATSSLYGGDMTSPKEAAVLQGEIDSLSKRQSILEDQIIELMEKIEPYATEETRNSTARSNCQEAIAVIEGKITSALSELEDERQSVVEEKRGVETRAGGNLVKLYEDNRKRMGDHTAVGRLVGTSCGACFLEIAAVEIDRIRRLPSDQPSECPECGALVVR
jgi:predicted  nucleic acid-binding Zn-ribbon protein